MNSCLPSTSLALVDLAEPDSIVYLIRRVRSSAMLQRFWIVYVRVSVGFLVFSESLIVFTMALSELMF